jgi:hypothetical protein
MTLEHPMTYRGIVSNGVIVIEGEKPAEGTVVEVRPETPLLDVVAQRPEPSPKNFADLPAFGMWRHRTDLPEDSADAVRVLRILNAGGRP